MSYNKSDSPIDEAIGLEAGEWLLQLDDSDSEGEPEFQDVKHRNQKFHEWLGRSPDHLRVFLETMEVHRRMLLIDDDRRIDEEDPLKRRLADVIVLPQTMHQKARAKAARGEPDSVSKFTRWRQLGMTVAVLLCAVAGGGYWWTHEAGAITTSIGEQRTAKLVDGSFIYLNTDTRVVIKFSSKTRDVLLTRGEAMFVVERDSSRPFIVTTGDTAVRAIGTQFNVRKRKEGAEIAVLEGSVRITTKSMPEKLTAGEQAKIVDGRIAPTYRVAVEDTMAWRRRRLIFHNARLTDVADEFNRYNRTKIRVEGTVARDVQLSGIFDADRPQALMLYAAKSSEFAVALEGNDWVIRGR